MDEPTDPKVLMLTTRRGRPRVPEPRASVSTWLPASEHEQLIALARRQGRSVSGLVRSAVQRQLRRPFPY